MSRARRRDVRTVRVRRRGVEAIVLVGGGGGVELGVEGGWGSLFRTVLEILGTWRALLRVISCGTSAPRVGDEV